MKTKITPFLGVGPLRFGDKEADVRGKLGAPAVEAFVKEWDAKRFDYNYPNIFCYFSEYKGLFLITIPAKEADFVLFGENAFTAGIIEAVKRQGVSVEAEHFSSSFGEETLYRAAQIGLVFACEVFDTRPQAIFCYERSAWEDYAKKCKNVL